MKSVVANFLRNHHHDQYADIVNRMMKAYKQLGAGMSLKMHFLHSHLYFFVLNLGELVMNKERDFTKLYLSQKGGNRVVLMPM